MQCYLKHHVIATLLTSGPDLLSFSQIRDLKPHNTLSSPNMIKWQEAGLVISK